MSRNCDICGNCYCPRNIQSLFCSTECKRLGRNARLQRNRLNKLTNVTCVECGTSFMQKSGQHTTFCDEKCKQKFYNRQYKYEGETTKAKIRRLIIDSRQGQGKCINCDEVDIRLFEFAHYDRNLKTIKSLSNHQSLYEVQTELTKGRWLCVWCHRKETMEENNVLYPETISTLKRIKAKSYIDNLKIDIGSCQICSKYVTLETVSFFEFDHIDPSNKIDNISNMVGLNKQLINEEIVKCRLLCCKCHRIHTIEQAIQVAETKRILATHHEDIPRTSLSAQCHGDVLVKILDSSKNPTMGSLSYPLLNERNVVHKPLTLNIIR